MTKNVIRVVAAIITRGDGQVLVTRRAPDKNEGGRWEFPGGKIEPGETPEAALAREISEELEISVKVGQLFMESTHSYSDLEVLLQAYFCEQVGGSLHLTVHDRAEWADRKDLARYDFAPADVPIVKALALK